MEDTQVEHSYNPTATKILETAARLFMQLGYSAVSINDIVKAAEITKPTLYYYFRDKEELFVQMALQRLIEVNRALAAAAESESLRAQLSGMAAVLLDDSNGDMRMLRHEMAEHLSEASQQRLGTAFYHYLFEPVRLVMQAGLERGELSRHSSAELTMLFLGVMEAFHGFAGQAGTMALPAQVGRLRAGVFAPAAVVGLFLHGVSGIEEAGDPR